MQAVQDTMQDRRDEDRKGRQESHAAEDCIGRSKELRRIARQRRNWAHAGENHAGVQQGVHPVQGRPN